MKLSDCIKDIKLYLSALMVAFLIPNIQAQESVDSTRIKRPMPKIVKEQTAEAEKEWLKLWNKGPSKLVWDELPLQEGDKAPDFELQNSSNELIKLSDLWKEKPMLLIFWRHTGCGCGFARAAEIRKQYDSITKMGIQVITITQAEPERAAFYAKEQGLKGQLLSDPNYQVYRAYDLLDGNGPQILGTADIDYSIGKKLQEDRSGTQRALVDNPWLLPGEFIIDKSGLVQFTYRYDNCDDIPEYWQLEAELKSVAEKK
ncbi:AhpC/TSA family protein [Maribacter sp. ANRC-HE7]|uniref:thioredoxin-dependent peroxiredoxin n=1 Tax=Maribacter aquimaris TaxID=2737171 RepID=A0ABR7V5L9_9FLAO|nr:peroxiredoxin-like family protein [Maribacter aquimaris]MBD0780099.1 AhpC/TSA family protein [Maribacter aquimaris]